MGAVQYEHRFFYSTPWTSSRIQVTLHIIII